MPTSIAVRECAHSAQINWNGAEDRVAKQGEAVLNPSGVMSQRPAPDLSVNKVLAGAGAAVTAAVIGSFFGVAGTVVGAAVGSVASTIATSLYELSLNTTRDRIKARLNAGGDPDVEEDRPAPPPPRPWGRWVAATALVFLLGMLVVTGVEFVKGSSIAGTPGTSVGGVLEPSTAGADTPTADPTTTSKARSTKERATKSATPRPSATVTPSPSATPTTTAPAAPGPVVSGTAG
jgi:hypothetical protein